MVKNVLKKNEKRRKNNKGFSLVELIVVIAIMAVLVGVLAPQLIKYVEKSREATDIQNCDSIVTAIKSYYADKDVLPTTVKVKLSSTCTLTEGSTASTEALQEAGLASAKLKGKKWTAITITYTPSTGTVVYSLDEATTDSYYMVDEADSSKFVKRELSGD